MQMTGLHPTLCMSRTAGLELVDIPQLYRAGFSGYRELWYWVYRQIIVSTSSSSTIILLVSVKMQFRHEAIMRRYVLDEPFV